ncbi:MAG TPA: redox-sensing transcriptional repressor Rex [bacterium]|nr:redox-sensing transcriptional repressor Rex [bacterium]
MGKEKNISTETIKRLIIYLRYLDTLNKNGIKIISSENITSLLNVQPSQFRKDLSFFGEFGKRGVGYNVDSLANSIRKILGVNREIDVVLIGVGKLGSALIQYTGFKKINVNIVSCFDKNPDKIGTMVENIRVEDIKNIGKTLKRTGIRIAILCVPVEEAQSVAKYIVGFGIKGILNFAPATLVLPAEVNVSNVDMASELGNIIYYLK